MAATMMDLHEELARFALGARFSEDTCLAMMLLFHTHQIWLRGPVIDDSVVARLTVAD